MSCFSHGATDIKAEVYMCFGLKYYFSVFENYTRWCVLKWKQKLNLI